MSCTHVVRPVHHFYSSVISQPNSTRTYFPCADQIQIRKEVDTSTEAVLEGDGAQFYCAFDGNPAPTIKWKLNDDEVQNGGDSGRFIISSFSLEFDCIMTVTSTFNILFTKAQDNGLVECEATNTNSEGTQFTAASNTSLTVHMHSGELCHSLPPCRYTCIYLIGWLPM